MTETVVGAELTEDRLSPLKLKRVGIDTYRENVAYMHRECDRYRAEGFQALAKVEVRADGRRILATLAIGVWRWRATVSPTRSCA